MKKTWKFPSIAGQFLIPAVALFSFTQCTEDEEITPAVTPTATAATMNSGADPVLSLTVDGLYTEFVSVLDCKTCNYVVPADASVIDGKEIGIKPGQAICLDAKIKYGNLEFVNLIGEASKPILVAYSMSGAPTAPDAQDGE